MPEQTTQVGNENIQGTGTTTMSGNERLDARAAIYARAGASTRAEVELDREEHPSIVPMADAIEQDQIVDQSEEVRTVSEDSILRDESAAEQEVVEAAAETPAGEDPMVELKIFGQPRFVPQSKVDELGGIAAAQILISADHRLRQATQLANSYRELHTRAEAREAEVKRLESELLKRSSATGGTPSGQQSGGTTNAPLTDDALRAAVKNAVGVMFQGDVEGAEKALSDVFGMLANMRGQALSADDISNLVQAKVEAANLKSEALAAREKQAGVAEAERQDVNALMRTKYPDIVADEDAKLMAFGIFDLARRDARNKGRSLVELADEAGAKVMAKLSGNSASQTETAVQQDLTQRTHLKRRLPQAPRTSERSQNSAEEPQYPTSPKDIVNMLRVARGQPVQ